MFNYEDIRKKSKCSWKTRHSDAVLILKVSMSCPGWILWCWLACLICSPALSTAWYLFCFSSLYRFECLSAKLSVTTRPLDPVMCQKHTRISAELKWTAVTEYLDRSLYWGGIKPFVQSTIKVVVTTGSGTDLLLWYIIGHGQMSSLCPESKLHIKSTLHTLR